MVLLLFFSLHLFFFSILSLCKIVIHFISAAHRDMSKIEENEKKTTIQNIIAIKIRTETRSTAASESWLKLETKKVKLCTSNGNSIDLFVVIKKTRTEHPHTKCVCVCVRANGIHVLYSSDEGRV